jgi:GT2 family glycosyltransferase
MDETDQPLVSLVILTYNSSPFIRPCLQAVAASTWEPLEVIVVDNASADGTARSAESVAAELGLAIHLHRIPANAGCAGGNNIGWRMGRGGVVVFLNPDTEITPTCVAELVGPLMRDRTVGITGAKMYYPNSRRLQHAGGFIYPNGMTGHHGIGQEDAGGFDEPRDVDYVTGAALAIRRQLLEALGGFDEEYFPAYYEEVDLCYRARKAGARVVYVPQAVLTHHESVALGPGSLALRRLYARMRIQFCLKNFSVSHLLRHALPFEMRWLATESAARGNRLIQLGAYLANWRFALRKVAGRNRR